MNDYSAFDTPPQLIRHVVKNFDLATFQAKAVIDALKDMRKNGTPYSEGSMAVYLSKLRSQLLEKVFVEGYENAKEYYVDMRKQFKDAPLIPAELQKLKLEKSAYERLNKKSSKAVEKKNEKTDIVKNSEELLKEMREALKYKSFEKLYPALLFLTGRRAIEIGHLGKFKKCPNKTSCVLFYGQAKKRSRKSKAYEIPLLAPLKDIQKGLTNLRRLFPEFKEMDYNNEDISTTLWQRFQPFRAKWSEKLGFNVSAHTFRSIYAQYAWEKYNKKHPNGLTKNKYVEQILGHENLNESLHYNSIKLE